VDLLLKALDADLDRAVSRHEAEEPVGRS
jgi:hypothetical protein